MLISYIFQAFRWRRNEMKRRHSDYTENQLEVERDSAGERECGKRTRVPKIKAKRKSHYHLCPRVKSHHHQHNKNAIAIHSSPPFIHSPMGQYSNSMGTVCHANNKFVFSLQLFYADKRKTFRVRARWAHTNSATHSQILTVTSSARLPKSKTTSVRRRRRHHRCRRCACVHEWMAAHCEIRSIHSVCVASHGKRARCESHRVEWQWKRALRRINLSSQPKYVICSVGVEFQLQKTTTYKITIFVC